MEEDPIPSGSNIQLSTELNDGTWNKTKYPPCIVLQYLFHLRVDAGNIGICNYRFY